MVSKLSLIKSVPWFTNAAEAARVWAARSVWLLSFTSVIVKSILLSPLCPALTVKSCATPAVIISLARVMPSAVPVIGSSLSIRVTVSPDLKLLPPAMLFTLMVVPLKLAFIRLKAVSLFNATLLKLIVSKFAILLKVLPLPSMFKVLLLAFWLPPFKEISCLVPAATLMMLLVTLPLSL